MQDEKRSRKRRRNTDNGTVHPGTHRGNDKLYGNVQLIAKKAEVGPAGTMLSAQDGNGRLSGGFRNQTQLTAELEKLGMTGIDYEGKYIKSGGIRK